MTLLSPVVAAASLASYVMSLTWIEVLNNCALLTVCAGLSTVGRWAVCFWPTLHARRCRFSVRSLSVFRYLEGFALLVLCFRLPSGLFRRFLSLYFFVKFCEV